MNLKNKNHVRVYVYVPHANYLDEILRSGDKHCGFPLQHLGTRVDGENTVEILNHQNGQYVRRINIFGVNDIDIVSRDVEHNCKPL